MGLLNDKISRPFHGLRAVAFRCPSTQVLGYCHSSAPRTGIMNPYFYLAHSLHSTRATRSETPPQNRLLNLISKLKLLLRAVNFRVDACSYCAMKNSRSETRYSKARIWFGSDATLVE